MKMGKRLAGLAGALVGITLVLAAPAAGGPGGGGGMGRLLGGLGGSGGIARTLGGASRAAGGGFRGTGTGGFSGFRGSGVFRPTQPSLATSIINGHRQANANGTGYQKFAYGKIGGGRPAGKPQPGQPGSPEHKADRWAAYQKRQGQLPYPKWEKKYETCINNNKKGLSREAEYRAAWGGDRAILKTPYGPRQVDVYIPQKGGNRVVEIKTGYQRLTTHGQLPNTYAIMRDAALARQPNTKVEWVLEKGGSKELVNALKAAGIKVHLGPQIK
jgi:hypothetical protein